MDLWTALGNSFKLLFTFPIIRLGSLNNQNWRELFTIDSVCFMAFWILALCFAVGFGAGSRLWEALLVDASGGCNYVLSARGGCGLWVLGTVMALTLVSSIATRFYAQHLQENEWMRCNVEGITSYLEFALKGSTIGRAVKYIFHYLIMNLLGWVYYLHHRTDYEGELLYSKEGGKFLRTQETTQVWSTPLR